MRRARIIGASLSLFAVVATGCSGTGGSASSTSEAALSGKGPCASAHQMPKMCPPAGPWHRRGEYLDCVGNYLHRRLLAHDLTEEQSARLHKAAEESEINKPPQKPGPDFMHV